MVYWLLGLLGETPIIWDSRHGDSRVIGCTRFNEQYRVIGVNKKRRMIRVIGD